ncbi:PIPO, partial [Leek yellow stripe virus]|uniref:PIPO n=1 Tax=Leek yellow stripe virus TaxID=42004 RepID=UPI000265130C
KLSGSFTGAMARATFVAKIIFNHCYCKVLLAKCWTNKARRSRFRRQSTCIHKAITWCDCKNGQCSKRECATML